MQVHLVREGRRTTISVDDQLLSYLQERLGCKPLVMGAGAMARFAFEDQKKKRTAKARHWIQLRVDAAGDLLPEAGLSQWVQARILEAIVDPTLKGGGSAAKELELNARVRVLQEQRAQEWEAREAERKRLVARREAHEAAARAVARSTPRYRQPPKASI